MFFILLFGMKVFSPIPARIAAIGPAFAISPIARNKKKTKRMKRKRVSIEMNLNLVLPFLLSFPNKIVNANRENNESSVIIISYLECIPMPIRIPANINNIISIILSRVPISIMLCPSFVFVILNSFSIGIRISSPTATKDNATSAEIIQE